MDNEFLNAGEANEARFTKWREERSIDTKAMTHGEVYALRKEYNEWLVKNGFKFEYRVNPESFTPAKMDKNDAIQYYREKLNKIWLDQLDERLKALNIESA